MANSKAGCIGGIVTAVLVVVVVFVTYFCWPASEDNDDNDNNDNVSGDNNNIATTEDKSTEVSMFHIEGLQGQQRFSNWLTGFGFFFIFALILYAAVHFKYVKLPRRMRKRLERERVLSRLDDIEAVLVERGYMPKKIKKKGRKKSKKVTMSELMRKAKEAMEDDTGSEESE